MNCRGSWTVRSVLRYDHSQSSIFSFRPKQRLRSASCGASELGSRTDGLEAQTCDMTTTPSFEMWRSVSMACAPTSTAASKAAMVFSGSAALYPRCAIVCGIRRPSASFLASTKLAMASSARVEGARGDRARTVGNVHRVSHQRCPVVHASYVNSRDAMTSSAAQPMLGTELASVGNAIVPKSSVQATTITNSCDYAFLNPSLSPS